MDRRTFAKLALGVAAAGTAAAAGAGALVASKPPRAEPRELRYVGARAVAGPAPRGVPFLPLALADDGALEVDPARALDDLLVALRACGHEDAPALAESYRGDDRLRYHMDPGKLDAVNPWYRERLGEHVRPEEFPGDDAGAAVSWRSQNATGPHIVTAAVVRLPTNGVRHATEGDAAHRGQALSAQEHEAFLARYTVEAEGARFVATSTACPHFCCVMGWKEAEKLSRAHDAWDRLYCACHNVVCEPREPVWYRLTHDA